MFINPKDKNKNTKVIGSKALNLCQLIESGFKVPDFVIIPSDKVEIISDNDNLKLLLTKIKQEFLKNSYAVRSASLIEDQEKSSMAGQFHTELNVSFDQLGHAINKVIQQSESKNNNDLSKLSIIIQEYIEADMSGVVFTRNPTGEREMVIEWYKGRGEEIVSGKVKPNKESFYWQESISDKILKLVITEAKKIETIFGFPQDIEWCVKDHSLYILQSRPITTITKDQYESVKFLDKYLEEVSQEDYCYKKNEISEIAPRPTNITYSLLQKIYAPNGPIDNVYKNLGIKYSSQDFLIIIGNQLFIDSEKEIKSLLPSYTCLNQEYKAKPSSLRGIGRTLRNLFYITKDSKTTDFFSKFESAFQVELDIKKYNLFQALALFLKDYELIFEVNIKAAKYLKNLELLLRKENISISDVLIADLKILEEKEIVIENISSQDFIGNTLEFSDNSKFISYKRENKDGVESGFLVWWQKLSEIKKRLFKTAITKAITFQQYREYARCLMVKNISFLRVLLLQEAEKNNFKNKENIYFHNFEEIFANQINEGICLERKKIYQNNDKYILPAVITKRYLKKAEVNLGVSAGIAKGTLVNESMLGQSEKPVILYTQNLEPNLTKYFDQICGIVSENGGLLSHLSIIAREKGLPVVIANIADKNINLNDTVEINGSTGEVKKM